MNKFLTILYLPIIILFTNCSKSNESPSNSSYANVQVQREAITYNNPSNYTLHGTIISPSRVDMIDHGFIIKTSNGDFLKSLGAASKVGNVSTEYFNDQIAFLDTSMVIFYIQLETGAIISSSHYTNNVAPQNDEPYFAWTNHGIAPNASGLTIDTKIEMPNSARYTLVEYGIEYEDSIVFNPIGFATKIENSNLYEFNFVIPNNNSQMISMTLYNVSNGGNINLGIQYGYKFYLICLDNQTGQTIYKESNVFYYKLQP